MQIILHLFTSTTLLTALWLTAVPGLAAMPDSVPELTIPRLADSPQLEDFLAMTLRNYNRLQDHWLFKAFAALAREGRWVKHYNPVGRARRNVAHHYDLSGALYDLFLDRDRQYSCGYFM